MDYAGEVAQWLRVLTDLVEDLCSVPSNHDAYLANDSVVIEAGTHLHMASMQINL